LALGFDNPRFLNHAQTIQLPLLLAALHASRGRWRTVAGLALAFQIALLLYTRGRATQVALVVAPILVYAIGLPGSRRFLRDCLLSGLAGGLVFLAIYLPLSFWVGSQQLWALPGDVGSMTIRMRLWVQALASIQASPWLGLGLMHYSSLRMDQGAHPHNVYLQWAAEYGLPAALLMVAGLGMMLWRGLTFLRKHDAQAQPFALAAFVACVAALIDATFSGNFVMPVSQLWLALGFGLLLGHLPASTVPSHSRAWALVAWLLLVVQVGYAVMTLLDWLSTPPHLGEALVLPPQGKLLPPRHWLHGWF
jgi:O-antigen ligase